MQRRDFLKTAAAAGAGVALGGVSACSSSQKSSSPLAYQVGGKARMKLSFFPYELKLQHTFTVAS